MYTPLVICREQITVITFNYILEDAFHYFIHVSWLAEKGNSLIIQKCIVKMCFLKILNDSELLIGIWAETIAIK